MVLKKSLGVLFLTVLLTLTLAGAGCSVGSLTTKSNTPDTASMEGFLTYTNTTDGISIQYPKDWKKEEGASGTIVAFKSPQEAGDKFLENVNLVSEDVSQAPGITVKDYEKAALDLIKQSATQPGAQVKDIKEVEKKDITLSGLPGRLVVYTSTFVETGAKLYARQYFTIKNNIVYIITYTSSQEKPDAFMDVVQKMVTSFKITK